MSLTSQQKAELDAIAENADDGKLHAAAIVEFARDPSTALHKRFDWNDASAASKYRIEQARQLIEVYVTEVPNVGPVRAFVSLKEDRKSGGGYTPIDVAMSSVVTRRLLVSQFIEDLRILLRRYSYLYKIAQPLFDEVEKACVRSESAPRRAASQTAARQDSLGGA